MIGEDVDLEDRFERDFKGINLTTSGKTVFDKTLLIKKFALQGWVILETAEKVPSELAGPAIIFG